jgi:hypothetical protein
VDEEAGRQALESISELVEVHPKFVKPMFSQLLVLTTEILQANLESTTKGTKINLGSSLNVIVMMSVAMP